LISPERLESKTMPLVSLALMLMLILASSSVNAAKPRAFIDEAEPAAPSSVREGKAWEEEAAALPPWPQEGDLVEFRLDSPSSFRFFIDGRHLAIGRDGVVRYTLVAESASGARNVSVEGLRCTVNGAFRVYAYGSGDAFRPLADGDWQAIRNRSGDSLHEELHGHFLCGPRTFEPRPIKDILRALGGQIQARENAGFLPD
jgi:hypothetical protein